jgi:hypothetical protein
VGESIRGVGGYPSTGPVYAADFTAWSKSKQLVSAVLGLPLLVFLMAGVGWIAMALAQERGSSLPLGVGVAAGAVLGIGLGLARLVAVARKRTWIDDGALVFRMWRTRRVELARARSVVVARIDHRRFRRGIVGLVVSIVDGDGRVWWLQFWVRPLMSITPEMAWHLAETLRRADCPGADEAAGILAELTPAPAALPRIPVAELPRWVTGLRWTWVPVALMGVLVVPAIFFLPTAVGESGPARAVPADVCSLIPDELLARVVPAGEIDDQSGGGRPSRAVCSVHAGSARTDSTGTASLDITVERYQGRRWTSREDEARDWFAWTKRLLLDKDDATFTTRVSDLADLGDSAYLEVEDRSGSGDEGRENLTVHVLNGDTILTVSYSASPTDETLVASAAVTVARALLEGLR